MDPIRTCKVTSCKSVRNAEELLLLECLLIIACNLVVQGHINLNCESS